MCNTALVRGATVAQGKSVARRELTTASSSVRRKAGDRTSRTADAGRGFSVALNGARQASSEDPPTLR